MSTGGTAQAPAALVRAYSFTEILEKDYRD
jgi:hypothetical protein